MDLPDQIGVMILPGITLFPQAMLPLYIFEPRYRKMLQAALETHRFFCVAMRRPGSAREVPEPVAGLGLIRASVGHSDGTSHIVLQGLARVRLGRATRYKPYRTHEIQPLPTTRGQGAAVEKRLAKVKELVAQRLELGLTLALPGMPKSANTKEALVKAREVLRYLDSLSDPEQVADMVACSMLQDAMHRQVVLETADLELRLRQLANCLGREIEDLNSGEAQI
ncbi:hypothetical protein GC207_03270 [bacterium]|nr:hypothetical protein [bacterium]